MLKFYPLPSKLILTEQFCRNVKYLYISCWNCFGELSLTSFIMTMHASLSDLGSLSFNALLSPLWHDTERFFESEKELTLKLLDNGDYFNFMKSFQFLFLYTGYYRLTIDS